MTERNYFTTKGHPDRRFPCFKGNPTPSCESPVFDILGKLGLTPEDFSSKANRLFANYRIEVPEIYPKKASVKRKLFGEYILEPWNEFAICVGCCILIDEKFNVNVSRILKNELIKNNSREGILHASSLASLFLYYLNCGFQPCLQKETNEHTTADFVLDGLRCELKVVDESDWSKDINHSTGRGKRKDLSEDICFDLGRFLSNKSGRKGIIQADVVFADLSLKSLGWVNQNGWITKNRPGLPKPKKHRIIYFSREIIYYDGFFVDFSAKLWNLIKNTQTKHSFGIYPPPRNRE